MGKKSGKRGRYQLGNYWLWYRADRDDWCICWLDRGTTRRISLGISGGPGDTPPDEAQRALTNHYTANEQSQAFDLPPSKVLVDDITRQWLTGYVQRRLNDPARYAHSVLVLERFYEDQRKRGKMPDPYTVATVRSPFVEDFIDFRRKEGASTPTISRDLAALRGPILWALNEGILASAPKIKDVEGRSVSRDLIYTPKEIAALLRVAVERCDRHHIALYIMIAMSTHGRSQAILELNAELQIRDGRITFNRPGRIQTRKKRPIVPIAPTLAPWLRGRSGSVIRYVSEPSEDGSRVVKTGLGDIGNAFEACLIAAGALEGGEALRVPVLDSDGEQIILPPRVKLGENEGRPAWKGVGTPNTLRHSLHTYLSARGVPQAQIDTAAGHTTNKGTGGKYDHVRPEYLREFIAGVEEFWREVDEFTDVHRRPLDPSLGETAKRIKNGTRGEANDRAE